MKRVFSISLFCAAFAFLVTASSASALEWSKVVDYGDPGYSDEGNWRTWIFPGAINGEWRYLSGFYETTSGLPRMGTATWKTQVPVSGLYQVAVHHYTTDNRTTDADFNVYDGKGQVHHFSVNQRHLPTGWHVLGTFKWKKNGEAKVILNGRDDNMSDEADAVRWVLIEEIIDPVVAPPTTLLLKK